MSRDVEDVLFLAGRHHVTADQVKACAEQMPDPAKQQIIENLVCLQILKP